MPGDFMTNIALICGSLAVACAVLAANAGLMALLVWFLETLG